ncbi:MAG TPA: S41 family peptidase [Candidatus Saccharimonadales bacterium]
MPTPDSAKAKKKFALSWGHLRSSTTYKTAGLAVAALVIFFAGVGVGNGSIFLHGVSNDANKNLPNTLDYGTVTQVYNLLKTHYDGKLDATKLLDGMKIGLASATGDPYTQYFSKDEAQKFNEELSGSFTGIGAELSLDADGNLIVQTPIKGFPAEKAGLRAQDIIVSIDGTTTSGMSVDKAVSLIRGPKDTKVALRILRDKKADLTFTITRDQITVPSVNWQMLDGGVGYIAVTQFNEDTTNLMNQAGRDLKDQGAKSILLDLRGNPGGLLSAAVDMAKMWLPQGKTIVQEKRGGTVTDSYTSDGGGLFNGMKTAVLIDAGSASAAEIVSGALRDNNVATLFGVKSFGKGSVQQIQNLPDGTEIKITVARWYRPNGQNIDKKGISPDHEVKMTDDDYKQKLDPQKDAALSFLQNQ